MFCVLDWSMVKIPSHGWNLSKLLDPTEIGKMFCLLGLAKALMKMIGKPLFSLLYKVIGDLFDFFLPDIQLFRKWRYCRRQSKPTPRFASLSSSSSSLSFSDWSSSTTWGRYGTRKERIVRKRKKIWNDWLRAMKNILLIIKQCRTQMRKYNLFSQTASFINNKQP